ncbi:MAG: hypothetical protein GF329_22545 [Candidatus Lokiarchaeota archaeon]|nr:hypothetical protein [Candidatus Lokiarchaeota archaeon]
MIFKWDGKVKEINDPANNDGSLTSLEEKESARKSAAKKSGGKGVSVVICKGLGANQFQ